MFKNIKIGFFRVIMMFFLLFFIVSCGKESSNVNDPKEEIVETFIVEELTDNSELFGEDLIPFREGDRETGKWGYINNKGDVIIQPAYAYASKFSSNDRAIVATYENYTFSSGVINKEGEYVIENRYDNITVYDNGFYVTSKYNSNDHTEKSLILDKNGFVIFDSETFADKYNSFSIDDYIENHDIYIFTMKDSENNRACGYMKMNGEIVVEPIYSDCGRFADNGLAYASPMKPYSGIDVGGSDSNYGYINLKGEFVIGPNENWSEAVFILSDEDKSFNEGFALVYDLSLEKVYFIDELGNNVFGKTFDEASKFVNGVANVYLENGVKMYQMTYKKAQLNKYGNLESKFVEENYDYEEDWVSEEVNGRVKFSKDSKIGYMDSDKNVVVEAIYDQCDYDYTTGDFFSDGYAVVCLNNKSFLIDLNGKLLFESQFDVIKDNDY